MRDIHIHKYPIHICICFSYVCHLTIHHNGGGLRPPPQQWGGRLRRPPHCCGIHYGGWWGGKHRKNICKYVSDIYVFVYLAYFNIFPLRDSWSYFISEIWMSETPKWPNTCQKNPGTSFFQKKKPQREAALRIRGFYPEKKPLREAAQRMRDLYT